MNEALFGVAILCTALGGLIGGFIERRRARANGKADRADYVKLTEAYVRLTQVITKYGPDDRQMVAQILAQGGEILAILKVRELREHEAQLREQGAERERQHQRDDG